MKLCWGLLTKPDALWVRCLKSKYACGTEKIPMINKKKNQSAVWSAIVRVWGKFKKKLGSKLRSGRNTNAWWETWSPLEQPLIQYIDKNSEWVSHEESVRAFVSPNGSWDIMKWRLFLPEWVIEKIKMVKPPTAEGEDLFYWKASNDGNFSVRSAYKMLGSINESIREPLWQQIWRWPIPERAKFFMWQVFHGRLPTNSIRKLRGLSVHGECPFECLGEESILHTLRDCEAAYTVWQVLIDPIYYSTFFSGNLQEWILWNSKQEPGSRRVKNWPWLRIFGSACWLIWKNRCKKAFEGIAEQPRSIIQSCLHHLMEGVEQGRLKHRIYQIPDRADVKWSAPPSGYVRVDVDGSVNNHKIAACGGIVRDSNGMWMTGFQQKIGFTSTTAAELQAIKAGMQICKQMKLTKVKLHSDSLEAIQLLISGYGPYHPLAQDIIEIRSLIYSGWDIEILHSNREALKCADYLAKMAQEANTDLCLLQVPPTCCLNQMLVDLG